MALNSPGVEVKVIDESFYTPAEPGTTPLIIVASAENKINGAGDGVAPGTLKANAGKVYLMTSQRELVDTFGDPVFKTDVNNNPIHAGEQNEYGLQTAYSALGVSSRAFVVRADLDLNQLNPSVDAPTAAPRNGTYWLNTEATKWGIFEWDNRPARDGGQKFVNKIPVVITDFTKVNALTGGPIGAVGKVGSYAIIAIDSNASTPQLNDNHPMSVWYKNSTGAWVQVGSEDWRGTEENELKLAIQPHTQVPQWKDTAEDAPNGSVWIKTTEPNLGARWRTSRYNSITQLFEPVESPIYSNNEQALFSLDRVAGGQNLAVGTLYTKHTLSDQGVSFKIYRRKAAAPTQIKTAKITTSTFHEAGSPVGAVATLNGIPATGITAGTYSITGLTATDPTGSGLNLTVTVAPTTLAVSVVINNGGIGFSVNDSIIVPGTAIGGVSPGNNFNITVATLVQPSAYTFTMAETVSGSDVLDTPKPVSIIGTGSAVGNAEALASAINAAAFKHITAEIDSQNRVVISHELGGDFHLTDGNGSPLSALGITPFDPSNGTGTANLYTDLDGVHNYVASLWEPLVYVAAEDPPTSLTENGQLWYSSVIDEIDIMVHDGSTWVGYLTEFPDTDVQGPFVTATAPEKQRDGSVLETGDLWIDTGDIENFPTIYKYNKDFLKWVLVDKTDQSTEDGILFADARYNVDGRNSDKAGAIEELLGSNYLDPDAPDPALYPKGMLLWNLRRSGFNVKEFRINYIDVTADNPRQEDVAMDEYYPHRWVTVSANQDDGSGSFGRKAQRKVVVQALQSLVNSNQEIRDDESRIFNLIACPGYPELIGEMISLNYDRGLTAFVIGDTPARLTSDATSLLAWGSNQKLAVEDNDLGAVSFDEYMGMFYPWGFTSDNAGNNVVVPPSHMILRTIINNDQVAYPWFAPAGVRRGGITNATSVGYVNGEGEFTSVALNLGQRDTLYDQKINPITFLTGTGLVNYGQKTRARAASALDRINVARLVIYLRRQLNALAKPYIFEPNDKITRDEIKAAVETLLVELVGQRALYDFLVVCDETNNTPARIDRNELWIDIAIEPVKAVEFIYIPLRLKNTGEIAGL